jgi:5'/3'-nucleotidase SurE
LEVLCPRYFDGVPDIVIAGTNQGFNLALAFLASGTYAAAEYGVLQGIPGIAFSSGNKAIRPYTDIQGEQDQANIYAEMIMDLVLHLQSNRTEREPLLPRGIGLNVNFPDAMKRQCTAVESKWAQTRLLSTISKSPVSVFVGRVVPCLLHFLLLRTPAFVVRRASASFPLSPASSEEAS